MQFIVARPIVWLRLKTFIILHILRWFLSQSLENILHSFLVQHSLSSFLFEHHSLSLRTSLGLGHFNFFFRSSQVEDHDVFVIMTACCWVVPGSFPRSRKRGKSCCCRVDRQFKLSDWVYDEFLKRKKKLHREDDTRKTTPLGTSSWSVVCHTHDLSYQFWIFCACSNVASIVEAIICRQGQSSCKQDPPTNLA